MPKIRKTIGVVAPACRLSPEQAEEVAALTRRLYPDGSVSLVFHPQCFLSDGHFAGPDEERAKAFVAFANDPEIDALWFARGGYGSFRLLKDVIPLLSDEARRKQYLGYSDLGSVLGALYQQGFLHVAHGPMVSEISRVGGEALISRALAFLVDGDCGGIEPHVLQGVPTVAFNITILSHLVGTRWAPDLTNHFLMLEDVSEPLYRIDRALGQIFSAPCLGRPAGILLGRCSDIIANDPDFGRTEEEIARYWTMRAGLAWAGRADIGHDVSNKIVPFGLFDGKKKT